MLCAISGEAPQVPVASKKSGTVFEKRLIEAYITENGTDPVTGEELSTDDLVDLKSARIVKPRPPTLTSIPSLLSVFQNEWDALTLESYTLKQHLSQLRQELSNALYNNDAAVRVIARLTKERNEARDALSKVSMNDRRKGATNGDATGHGDAMQVDVPALPESILTKVIALQEQLSKTRRKRPVPEGWVDTEIIQSMSTTSPVKLLAPGSKALAVDTSGTLALVGGADGNGVVYSFAGQETTYVLQVGSGTINDSICFTDREPLSILAMSTGEVKTFCQDRETAVLKSHAGPVTAIALHPCGELLGSVGDDKSFIFYDLVNEVMISQVYTTAQLSCCQFHPDGHIFAAGGMDGQIKVFDVKSSANVANFDMAGPIQALSFSENGTWLAAIIQGSTEVTVWDLRKAEVLKTLEFGSKIDSIQWDYTGQYLAGAGPGGVVVYYYDKSSKSWTELLRKAVSATAVQWGHMAKSVVLLTTDGALEILR